MIQTEANGECDKFNWAAFLDYVQQIVDAKHTNSIHMYKPTDHTVWWMRANGEWNNKHLKYSIMKQ